jgi:hypothetical protein
MTLWGQRRLPIVFPPVPGEALDSWIECYARRLHASTTGLLTAAGMTVIRMRELLHRLEDRQAEQLSAATGVSIQDLKAMTLQPWDGLAVRYNVIGAPRDDPVGFARLTGTRWCPHCLADSGGRFQLCWRLGWTFACPRHEVLLVDWCPGCGQRPLPQRTGKRHGNPSPAASCLRRDPAADTSDADCGHQLTDATTAMLPADGAVLNAQRRIDAILATAPGTAQRAAARADLAEIAILAVKALTILQTARCLSSDRPALLDQILTEANWPTQPTHPRHRPNTDAATIAAVTALALTAHTAADPHSTQILAWIVREDPYPLVNNRPGPGRVLRSWRSPRPELLGRVLSELDGRLTNLGRLRHRSAGRRPEVPASDDQVRARAAKIPATLWPGWSMRLLPPALSGPRTRPGVIRDALAALLLIPGGTLDYRHAAALLGGHCDELDLSQTLSRHPKPFTDTWLRTLADLSAALDEHSAPINYARRRALFTPATVTIGTEAADALDAADGPAPDIARTAEAHRYLLHLLTAGHIQRSHTRDAPPVWPAPPPPLAEILHQRARQLLDARGIDEPVRWEPPKDWLPHAHIPGIEPEQVSLRPSAGSRADPVHQDAIALDTLPPGHLTLYQELYPLAAPASSWASPPRSAATVCADVARTLYLDQGKSIAAIAAATGTTDHRVRRALLGTGAISASRPKRPDPITIPIAVIDQALHEGTNSVQLARALGLRPGTVRRLAGQAGRAFPSRASTFQAHQAHFAAITPPLHPGLLTVLRLPRATERLRAIIALTGHPTVRAAAQAWGTTESGQYQRIRAIHKHAQIQIFDPIKTLTPTADGSVFLADTRRLLAILDETPPGVTGDASAPTQRDPLTSHLARPKNTDH